VGGAWSTTTSVLGVKKQHLELRSVTNSNRRLLCNCNWDPWLYRILY